MRINGKRLDMPPVVITPIIRGEEEVIFKAGAVLDFKEFEAVCPVPAPPMITHKGSTEPVPDINDKKYKDAISKYGRRRTTYMIIKSLASTEKLEWETVDITKPDTYENFEKELHDAGMNQIEVGRLVASVMEANGLDDDKIEAAKKRFLAGKAAVV